MMSEKKDIGTDEGTTSEKRLLYVTAGNLRQSHIYINRHYDLFGPCCFGSSRRSGNNGSREISIRLEGLDETVTTDIGRDARTGKPRAFLRGRGWVRRFYEYHEISPGDVMVLERTKDRTYRLSPLATDGNSTRRFRVGEFFAGIGLVRLALENHGFSVVFANDIDPNKLAMYKDNFDAKHFHLGDIHHLAVDEIPDCDLFTASFPCNDLSIAGAMAGLNSGQSSAFWGLLRILDDLGERKPPIILFENVPGFLMSHGGKDFEAAISALNRLGYACDAFFLDAVRFAPQSRLRLFVIAKLNAIGNVPFGLEPSPLRPQPLVDFIQWHPQIRWDLASLPDPPESRARLTDVIEELADDDPAWWSEERKNYFVGQLSERHLAVAQKMIGSRRVSYATAFRRVRHGRSMAELRADGIAGCLRTPRGGSGRQILFKAGRGKYQVRLLTPRECARLQGVPDRYVIQVPLNQALFGFGDAVCVPGIAWIGENYLLPYLCKAASCANRSMSGLAEER